MTSQVSVWIILPFTSDADNLSFLLDENTTIEELKDLIERKHRMTPPKATQRLINRGRIIKENKKLKDFIYYTGDIPRVVFHLECHTNESVFKQREQASQGQEGNTQEDVGRNNTAAVNPQSTYERPSVVENNNGQQLYYELAVPRFIFNFFSWHLLIVGVMCFLLPHVMGVLVFVYVFYLLIRYLILHFVNNQLYHNLDWRNAPQEIRPFLAIVCPFFCSFFSSFNPEEFRHVRATTSTPKPPNNSEDNKSFTIHNNDNSCTAQTNPKSRLEHDTVD